MLINTTGSRCTFSPSSGSKPLEGGIRYHNSKTALFLKIASRLRLCSGIVEIKDSASKSFFLNRGSAIKWLDHRGTKLTASSTNIARYIKLFVESQAQAKPTKTTRPPLAKRPDKGTAPTTPPTAAPKRRDPPKASTPVPRPSLVTPSSIPTKTTTFAQFKSSDLNTLRELISQGCHPNKTLIWNQGLLELTKLAPTTPKPTMSALSTSDVEKHDSRKASFCFNDPIRLRGNTTELKHVDSYYDYVPTSDNTEDVWVNFANQYLGGGALGRGFVQEEVMASEMPEFAAFLAANQKNIGGGEHTCKFQTRTGADTASRGNPTPLLMEGLHRVQAIRAYGHQGLDKLNMSDPTQIRKLDSPQTVNVLAIAAPKIYKKKRGTQTFKSKTELKSEGTSRDVTQDLFNTAYAGFKLAKSRSSAKGKATCTIHTGAWGSGDFGNNLVAVILAQTLAAKCAGTEVQFHTEGPNAKADVKKAASIWKTIEANINQQTTIGACFDVLAQAIEVYGRT
ncbi:MAG: hypothetical protein ACI9S8_002347 [Chlamydiales bacterium]|jgi:hypothetical protein